MNTWRNVTGKQLSSIDWLVTHHKAKLTERMNFVSKNISKSDKTIVDIGCGPALWLDLIDKIASDDCTFIGIDSDEDTIKYAKKWLNHGIEKNIFFNYDIENELEKIPSADVILVFNMFSYIKDPDVFLEKLKHKLNPNGRVIIRQYDDGILRVGPLEEETRKSIDNSLYSSLILSNEFSHYDMDRVFNVINLASYPVKKIEMELYYKVSPYSKEVEKYIKEHLLWEQGYVSDSDKLLLNNWIEKQFDNNSYFLGVDLVSFLSIS